MSWPLFVFGKLPYLLFGISVALFFVLDRENKHWSYFFMFLTLFSRT